MRFASEKLGSTPLNSLLGVGLLSAYVTNYDVDREGLLVMLRIIGGKRAFIYLTIFLPLPFLHSFCKFAEFRLLHFACTLSFNVE